MSELVLMPVYNEAATVGQVLDAVRAHYAGDIVVVDDGSADGTGTVLAARGDVDVITHPRNLGYGRALAEGFAVAGARGASYVVTMDCDGQHEPKHITEFFAEVARAGDIVSGSRYLPQSREVGSAPAGRREVNTQVTAEINRVTGWGLTDAFCGFKAYRVRSLARLRLTEPGYAMPLELWAESYRAGLDVREIAVERIYHDHDRSFGEDLDDADARLAYYMRVWRRALSEVSDG